MAIIWLVVALGILALGRWLLVGLGEAFWDYMHSFECNINLEELDGLD